MVYFQVRYDSRVVFYVRKMFIRLATGYPEIGTLFGPNPLQGTSHLLSQRVGFISNSSLEIRSNTSNTSFSLRKVFFILVTQL